ncbi:MAG TPA: hypothetical protein VEA99_09915 [Gemmatimonadaceae bacterium]|nr:hypothetical protein [Gemmatimonadaceae bacterium]
MSAESLRDALQAIGIECEVEPHGSLALLRAPIGTSGLEAPERRFAAIKAAREHGFAAIAVEILD